MVRLFSFALLAVSLLLVSVISSLEQTVIPDISAQEESRFVTAEGRKLFLHGQEFQFTGVNAFNLATYPGFNAGCGGYIEDIDGFFSHLRPNAVVRLWAFQGSTATNTVTKKLDWSGLDRVVNAAQKNGKKLIMVLGNQDGNCDDGHYKDRNWYNGGYNQAINKNGSGLTPLPYIEYVKQIVARYKDSEVVAMWEPINEPAAGDCMSGTGVYCYSNLQCLDERASAEALKSFFDVIGDTIRGIDQNHLISSGALGNGQCGTIYNDYEFVHQSRGIDVASYHDYDDVDKPIPGDPWNGLQKRIDQMTTLNKPLYIGEVGMVAHGPGCMTSLERRDKMKAKMDAMFAAGLVGFVPWSFTATGAVGCNFDIVLDDPLLTLLHDYPVSMSTNTAVSNTPFPVATPIPNDTQPPSAPVLVVTGKTTSQVNLSWSGAVDNIGVNRYEIYRDYQYIGATTASTFNVTNLNAGQTYLFYIKSRDKAGNSSNASNKLQVTTNYLTPTPTPTPVPTPLPPDTQAPTAPTSLTYTGLTSSHVTLNWSGATDNRGINRYEVYRDYQYIGATSNTSFTVSGLTAGRRYVFYIKSRDVANNSSNASPKLTVQTPYLTATPTPTPVPTPLPPDTEAPTAPAILTPTNVTQNSVLLSWSGATDNRGVNRYEIYRDYQYIGVAFTTNFQVTGLVPGRKYLFYIKSRDAAGNSSNASPKITVTTLP